MEKRLQMHWKEHKLDRNTLFFLSTGSEWCGCTKLSAVIWGFNQSIIFISFIKIIKYFSWGAGYHAKIIKGATGRHYLTCKEHLFNVTNAIRKQNYLIMLWKELLQHWPWDHRCLRASNRFPFAALAAPFNLKKTPPDPATVWLTESKMRPCINPASA